MFSKIVFCLAAVSALRQPAPDAFGPGDIPGPRGLFSNFLERTYN